jgi:putative transposase
VRWNATISREKGSVRAYMNFGVDEVGGVGGGWAMPRSPRIEYEGAQYHVMCRGDHQEAIFKDDKDREMFLETLGEMCERSGIVIYSYVLMGNHYHLLVETPAGNLVAGMRWFQSTYTARYNARHRERGHLFQGRYKAVLIDEGDPEYARTVSDYIHLNPARAGIVNPEEPKLKSYRWSSFPILCEGKKMPKWLRGDSVLGWHHWKFDQVRERRAYEKYLQGRATEYWEDEESARREEIRSGVKRGWCFGGEEFREKLEKLVAKVVKGKSRTSYVGEVLKRHDEVEAGKILAFGLERMGLKLAEARRLKHNDPRKQGLSWLVKSRSVVPDAWIQEALAMGDRSNVSRAVSAYREEATKEVRKWKRNLHICTD